MADRTETLALIQRFFASLSVRDFAGVMDCFSEDVIHDTPYGRREIGWEEFERYLIHRRRCYRSEYDAMVAMSDEKGRRGAAEFVLRATYTETDEWLGESPPKASGQVVTLSAGMFFEVDDGRISRLSFLIDQATFINRLAA